MLLRVQSVELCRNLTDSIRQGLVPALAEAGVLFVAGPLDGRRLLCVMAFRAEDVILILSQVSFRCQPQASPNRVFCQEVCQLLGVQRLVFGPQAPWAKSRASAAGERGRIGCIRLCQFHLLLQMLCTEDASDFRQPAFSICIASSLRVSEF